MIVPFTNDNVMILCSQTYMNLKLFIRKGRRHNKRFIGPKNKKTKRFIVDIKFIDLLPTSTNCNKDDLSVPNMIIYVTLSSFSPCHKRKLTKGFITYCVFIDEMMVVSYVQIDETKRNFMCKKLIVMQYFFIFHISSNVLLIIKPAQFPQKILVNCKIPIKIF